MRWSELSDLIGQEFRHHWRLALLTGLILGGLNAWLDEVDPTGRAGLYAGVVTTFAQLAVTAQAMKGWGYSVNGARIVPYIGQSIVSTFGLVLATIALLVPGLWLYARWFLATPIFVAESKGAIGSLGESFARTKGSTMPLIGIALFIGTLFIAPIVAGSIIFGEKSPPIFAAFAIYFVVFTALASGWLASVAAYRGLTGGLNALEEVFA
ncbi:hypothetical protein GCM10022281_16850 [Sphingomonas rosea]|uniref:Glycerophosphoryl diester phosphodiesterase membrane domain-containing protein n=1 Tax=Sphingomonas rosea TaxID=335605 RepID=A0ABP7U6D8_9SPHN